MHRTRWDGQTENGREDARIEGERKRKRYERSKGQGWRDAERRRKMPAASQKAREKERGRRWMERESRDRERERGYEIGARERNIFPDGTRITVETRKIMKLVLKSVKVNII